MVFKYWLVAGCFVAAALFAAGIVCAKEEPAKAVAGAKVVLPEPVSKALTEAFPKATVTKAESFDREGLLLYEVVLNDGGVELWAYVDANGTIDKIKSVVDVKSLPPAVARTVDRLRGGAEIRKVEKIDYRSDIRSEGGKETLVKLDKPRVEYKIMISRGAKEAHFIVAEDGKVTFPLKWRDSKESAQQHPPKPATK